MSQPPKDRTEREPDLSRVVSFSDNVLSVAITLLVFDVRVPSDWSQLDLHLAVVALGPRLLSFALSFSVIGVYWVAHHLMFRAVTRVSRRMLWINNLFLMMVSLVPASAALLSAFPGQRAAVVLYGLNLLGVGTSMRALWSYIIYYHADLGEPIEPGLVRSGKRRIGAGIVLAGVGVGLAWVNPWVSYAIYWVTPLSFAWIQFI
jgi:uncharacterized membrane protein